jgi:uncharacterized protein YbbC (DUF1343 family)
MQTGLDQLLGNSISLGKSRRIGLVTHPAAIASTTGNRCSATRFFAQSSQYQLIRLFGPEHGITGEAQDLIPVTQSAKNTVIPVVSLYGDSFESLTPSSEQLEDLDALVIDLQDVGSRYYTFQATMLYCMLACEKVGLPVWVLDRPNPLGGIVVEGPTIRSGFVSFVGPKPIATRHGMTMGELAQFYQADYFPELQLEVIPCRGWDRSTSGFEKRLWFPPSPNMPTVDTAIVYPGICLIEGTNMSEGRGTTRPFEMIGFPGVSGESICNLLLHEKIEGVEFLPISFRPTFQKHAGKSCGGIFIIPTKGFQPVRTGLAVLWAFKKLLQERFQWRTETYEFVSDIPAIDLLFGSDRERLALDTGEYWRDIAKTWEPEEVEFRERSTPYRIVESA